ncbi:MAG: 16S rRNA (uracil(1498)-N(3))-methyltransferase [Mycolicibacterium sp.]|uniref:16S rRNA (uracil(1498)-N(3))-methyltransferase n=1 Tax=Mycolicibacterium sp. TaxID=2320850 RepID=UPI003D0FABFB
MSRGLFYVDSLPEVGGVAVLDGDEGFHAANVRRTRPGEQLDLGDGAGRLAHCVVEAVGRGRLSARVQNLRMVERPSPAVTVVQALPKSERSELAVELATEAGADTLVAWQAARCVARWDGPEKVDKGLRRWAAVARSAARQSRRPFIPEIAGLLSTTALVERVRQAPRTSVLVLHEAAARPLADVAPTGDEVTLVVGPEGGITDEEIAVMTDAGAVAVRLGSTVLRTSTAAAVALGALGVLTPRWA